MPNYDEIIQQSQANVRSLSEKLKELDKLYQDIEALIKQPEIFDSKYEQIVKLSDDYTNSLGASVKIYLDGSNKLFTANINELSVKIKDFEKEISRLVNTDFTKLFHDLQEVFINQTRKDLTIEFKRLEEKSKDLQSKIDELKKQVERLEKLDFEKYFDRFQKTLSEIFGAVNAINLTLTNITQAISGIVHSLGDIQTSIESNHKETKSLIDSYKEIIERHLTDQDKQALKNAESLEAKISSLSEHSDQLKKGVRMNRLINIVGLTIIIIVVIYIATKL